METTVFILKIFGGVGILIFFIFLIFYSLNEKLSKFIKYLLSYLVFIATIGFLFILFGEAPLYIGLLAGLGWMVLIVLGSKVGNTSLPEPDDTKEFLDDDKNNWRTSQQATRNVLPYGRTYGECARCFGSISNRSQLNIGFWFKVKARSRFNPEAYCCMLRGWNAGSTQRLGQKTFLIGF